MNEASWNMTMTKNGDLKRDIVEKLKYSVGKNPEHAREHDWFAAAALAARDRIVDHWITTTQNVYEHKQKRVYYLSLEFLIGRLLTDALANLGILDECRAALSELGVDFDKVVELEPDAALGNGGLGRLAACFMESMATVGVAGFGYGIRYQHGLFRQLIQEGWQVERPEDWLSFGNPWEFERPEVAYVIGFGGRVETKSNTVEHQIWTPAQQVMALAYDTPIVGWQGRNVNTLRLWSARSPNVLRLEEFNRGDYLGAVAEQALSEAISRVLYPNDTTLAGQELRLKQEYFFTSASLQDLMRRHRLQYGDFRSLPDKVAIQLNDTHPALAVTELMRLLVDHEQFPWKDAWEITRRTISYTNHTLLPEALESWSVPLIERLLPRHMQIIYQINGDILEELRALPDTSDPFLSAVSLIDEQSGRRVRMGNLAFLGAHKVNGVSALHTELMKRTVFKDLHHYYPDRITNKTNGITPRRWLYQCNRPLSGLITAAIGEGWVDDLEKLEALAPLAEDASFRDRFAEAKRQNKIRLATIIGERLGIRTDPEAMFDIQIKRIHEYKRQLLNILEAIALYDEIRAQPTANWHPRVKVFAGKAAASYHQAKTIIKLINDVADVINQDPAVRGKLKIVFLPNYNVSLAERIIPAADLSVQISTAGMEASGTGNMKFALNGALTIGTLDGANVEIKERVGDDNIFIFGMTADEVAERRASGYDARAVIEATPALKDVLRAVEMGVFSHDDPNRYRDLVHGLYDNDHFMVTADFAAYSAAQARALAGFTDRTAWFEKAVLNTANVGWFSSDRTIRDYAREIWQALPIEK